MDILKFGGSIAAKVMAGGMSLARSGFPRLIRIETTNHCQAACVFCPRDTIGRAKGFMPQDLFEKVIDECAANHCRAVHLHNFGEPLLDKQLPERIAYAKRAGIKKVKLFSNGGLLKGDMAARLLRSGLNELKISVDGADSDEFERLRVGLSHTEVLDNTRRFREQRDAAGLKHELHIIATTCQSSNRDQTNAMLRDAVDHVEHTRLHNWGGSHGTLQKLQLRKPCDRLWRTFTILINGDVCLCCRDHAGKEILGNVQSHTIREIWNNERYRHLRQLHRESRQDEIPLCRNCSACFFGANADAA